MKHYYKNVIINSKKIGLIPALCTFMCFFFNNYSWQIHTNFTGNYTKGVVLLQPITATIEVTTHDHN